MKITRKTIEWLKRDEGNEIDYIAHYEEDGRDYEEGRLSLRYNRKNGNFEFYVHWLQSKEERVLKSSRDIREVVNWANQFMREMGYKDWNDIVDVE